MAEKIVVRLAEARDMQNVFELSNDDVVRANSIHTDKISWEEHVNWFRRVLQDTNVKFYIAETLNGEFVGQVRFFGEKGCWVVSISIAEPFRGQGMGREMLSLATKQSGCSSLAAYVKKDNVSSINFFTGMGYQKCENAENRDLLMFTAAYNPN